MSIYERKRTHPQAPAPVEDAGTKFEAQSTALSVAKEHLEERSPSTRLRKKARKQSLPASNKAGTTLRSESKATFVVKTPPYRPAKISLEILREAHPNPLQLAALMRLEDHPQQHYELKNVAYADVFWSAFTPRAQIAADAAEGTYADAFLSRYQAMPAKDQALLHALWAGRLSYVDIEVESCKKPVGFSSY